MDKSLKKDRKGSRILNIVIAVLLGIAITFFGYITYTYIQGQKAYDELGQYMNVSEESELIVDWDSLREINKDIVGWVYIPNTPVNYPIAQRAGNDNYYLKHNFNEQTSPKYGAEYGCPYLSGVNDPNWSDQANFVAGHHMNNGQMFAFIAKYVDQNIFDTNRDIYILTPEKNYKTRAFAVDKVKGWSTEVIIPNFQNEEQFMRYKTDVMNKSLVKQDDTKAEDITKIISLYTCSEPDNSYRIVLYCSAVEEFVGSVSLKEVETNIHDRIS